MGYAKEVPEGQGVIFISPMYWSNVAFDDTYDFHDGYGGKGFPSETTGFYVDGDGNRVDIDGHPLDADGNYIPQLTYTHENGKAVKLAVEPKEETVPEETQETEEAEDKTES